MSNETTSKDQNGEWVMPEPIFRSSEGFTPGAKSEAVTDEMETEPSAAEDAPTLDEQTEIFDETAMNHVRAAPAKPVVETKGGGCAKSAMMTFAFIAFVTVAILTAAIYFLFYYGRTDSGTF